MSSYLSQVRVETNFDGDTIVAIMKPMTFGDLLIIDPLLVQLNEARSTLSRLTNIDDRRIVEQQIADIGTLMISKSYEVLPKYLVKIDGLFDATGAVLEPSIIFESGYFVQLISDLLTELRNRSTPSDPPRPGGLLTGTSPG